MVCSVFPSEDNTRANRWCQTVPLDCSDGFPWSSYCQCCHHRAAQRHAHPLKDLHPILYKKTLHSLLTMWYSFYFSSCKLNFGPKIMLFALSSGSKNRQCAILFFFFLFLSRRFFYLPPCAFSLCTPLSLVFYLEKPQNSACLPHHVWQTWKQSPIKGKTFTSIQLECGGKKRHYTCSVLYLSGVGMS